MKIFKILLVTTLVLPLFSLLSFGIEDPYPNEPSYSMSVSASWEINGGCDLLAVCSGSAQLEHDYADAGMSDCYAKIGIEVYRNGQKILSQYKTVYGSVGATVYGPVSVDCSGISTDGLTAKAIAEVWGCFEGEGWADPFPPETDSDQVNYYAPDPPAPSTPSNLTITNAGESHESPILSWNSSSGCGTITYKLYRKPYIAGGNWELIYSGSSTTYTDWDVIIEPQALADDKFYYKVKAQNSGGSSGYSNLVSTWGITFH